MTKEMSERELTFWENAALNAMQGFMESQIKAESALGVIAPEALAKESFRVANAMLEERRRCVSSPK